MPLGIGATTLLLFHESYKELLTASDASLSLKLRDLKAWNREDPTRGR